MRVDDRTIVAAFYVDTNSADEAGRVGTTPEARMDRGANKVNVGDYVLAVDSDDEACVALVSEDTGEWLGLHMDESTWRPYSEFSEVPAPDMDERFVIADADAEDVLKRLLSPPRVARFKRRPRE